MADWTPLPTSVSSERIFPKLTAAQVARIAPHGRVRPGERGEVLQRAGDPIARIFVLNAGQLEAVRVGGDVEQLVAIFRVGQFTGEMNTLSGRPAMAQLRASESGEVIEVDRENLLALVQTDAELSEILMRAFILRRVELVAQGVGDVVLIGSHTRRERFASRNS